jgi:predicted dehydrogenase/threonine dehydrogenase-like Zn-dependent dehydrogenase
MKQILQNLKDGQTLLTEVPCPKNIKSNVLISSSKTVISLGTERMLVAFGKASYIKKAKQQPDKVKMVLNKIITDGFKPTFEAVRTKLDQPLPLGYCNAGIVLESDVDGIVPGDRVVSNGGHAEVVRVPKNLCVKIPENVDDESAAFTVMGAIGLQGIRLLKPTIGECIVVTGLGLVGLLCVQMLRANGCRVLGIDFDSSKCDLAKKFGAEIVNLSKGEDPLTISKIFSRGRGVDGVLIAASSESHDVIKQSAKMCRKRARIVLVGVVGLNLRRDDFYKKEITFQVSASYGPGRYDSFFEQEGNDYPIGYVRWTEQRNFEAVLDLMASGTLDLKPLVSNRYDICDGVEAYSLLDNSSTLGVVLNYPKKDIKSLKRSKVKLSTPAALSNLSTKPCVGFIGAGNYASRILIPAFKKSGVELNTLVSSGGISGMHHGKKNNFATVSTDIKDIWSNEKINLVSIVTRHNSHAEQVISALNHGKNVFVEKPLALTLGEIKDIDKAYQEANISNSVKLMVGFNRRFAPHIVKIKQLLKNEQSPKSIILTVNAGEIPLGNWVQDKLEGGGRIIGEGCHFVDLLRHIIGYKITKFNATMIGNVNGVDVREDKATITLSFEDGSFGTIHYLANGGKTFQKERIEIFCNNSVLQLNNFRTLKGYSWPGFKKMNLLSQDKGQNACAQAFVDSIRNNTTSPILYDEIIESSTVSIEIASLLNS